MAYSAELAHRIGTMLTERKTGYIEKQMFGGVAFMVNEKMCVGISRDKKTGEDRLMARIGPGFHEAALKRPGCHEMDFAGKPMQGFVFVHPEGYTADADLAFWIDKTLEYNNLPPALPARKKLVPKPPPVKVKPLPKKLPPAKKKPIAKKKSAKKKK